MAQARELELGKPTGWGWWASLAGMALVAVAMIWAAVTAPNAGAAWFFGGGAAFVIGLSLIGGYVFIRHSMIVIEHGTLVARTPFSVRRVALAEVARLEVKLQRTRGGIAYRELVVVDQSGATRASIRADDLSDSRVANFAKAAGLRFKLD
jgi:hypothetical protein